MLAHPNSLQSHLSSGSFLLFHMETAPGNGFSINKYLIQMHGTALNSDTTEALRFVKDTILSYGGILNIQITKSLFQSAKLAYSRYEAKLAAKQRLLEQTSKIEKQKEIEDTKHRETEEERNTRIASIQQVRIDKILLNIFSFHSFCIDTLQIIYVLK